MKIFKLFLISFIFTFALALSAPVLAQEEEIENADANAGQSTELINETLELDENIQAEDLGIAEPNILPDSPLYFLKNWSRGIQSIFTFNPVKKAELKLKFANEKLIEAKKLAETAENSEIIEKAMENYQQETEKIKEQTDKLKEKAADNPEIDKFLNKYVSQQILHQKLLQKLEERVPAQAIEKIKETREAHLEKFQDVMLKLEDRQEKITEKLDKILEEQKGSEFKNFKNLEILKNLEEKAPEQAKEAIQKAQENALKRLRGDLEKMSSENQERFTEYAEKISGAKEKHLEIIENLKSAGAITPDAAGIKLKEKLEEGTIKMLEKMEKKLEKINTSCPQWVAPGPGFCADGRIVTEKDSHGCYSIPRCVKPARTEGVIPPSTGQPTQACFQVWEPVCGKDGKTYSNACFANLAKTEIKHKGECEDISRCQEIICVWDPCPGEHIADSAGCVNCASPCKSGTKKPIPINPDDRKVCIQVITPAVSPEGICKEFPTPCHVPKEWKTVKQCPASALDLEETNIKTIPLIAPVQ